MLTETVVRAYWYTGNFGDMLTPWVIEKLSGQRAMQSDDGRPRHIVAGSILNIARPGDVVWGAGLANRTDQVNPQCDIRMVRGPLTRDIALSCGCQCPAVYGDPGWLLPSLTGLEAAGTGLGVIPHVADYEAVTSVLGGYLPIIDLRESVESVCRWIRDRGRIISSSLHGLIAADAFGVPNVWATFGDRVGGDGLKFADYFASVGRTNLNIDLRDITAKNVRAARGFARGKLDLGPLLESCPFTESLPSPAAHPA